MCLLSSLRINQSTETPDNLCLIIRANFLKNMIPTQQTYVHMKKYQRQKKNYYFDLLDMAKKYFKCQGKPQ